VRHVSHKATYGQRRARHFSDLGVIRQVDRTLPNFRLARYKLGEFRLLESPISPWRLCRSFPDLQGVYLPRLGQPRLCSIAAGSDSSG
jgi:hypothetical protein